MKKLSLILVISLLVSLVSINYAAASSLINKIDFENETVGGTYNGVAGTEIKQDANGKHLYFSSSTVNLGLISKTLPSQDAEKLTLDFEFKPVSNSQTIAVTMTGKDADDASAYYYISTSLKWGTIATMFGTSVNNVINQDKFYRIQYEINADSYTFNVYIDGNLVTQTPFEFRHKGNLVSALSGPYPLNGRVKFNQLMIATSGAAGTFAGSLDNVEVYEGTRTLISTPTPAPTATPVPAGESLMTTVDFENQTVGSTYNSIVGTLIKEQGGNKYLFYNTDAKNRTLVSSNLPGEDTEKLTLDFLFMPKEGSEPTTVSILGKDSDDGATAYHYVSTMLKFGSIVNIAGGSVTNVLNEEKFHRIQYEVDADAYNINIYVDGNLVTTTPFEFRHKGNIVSTLSGPYPLNGRVKFTSLSISTSGSTLTSPVFEGNLDNVMIYTGSKAIIPTPSPSPVPTPAATLSPVQPYLYNGSKYFYEPFNLAFSNVGAAYQGTGVSSGADLTIRERDGYNTYVEAGQNQNSQSILSFALTTPVPPSPTPKVFVAEENFESYELNAVYNNVAGTKIKEDNGNKYLNLVTSTANLQIISKSMPSDDKGKLSIDFMYKPSSGSGPVSVSLMGKDTDDTSTYIYVSTALFPTKITALYGATIDNVFSEEKFYRVQYEVDADNHTIDIYVDDVKVTETPFSFRHNQNLPSSLSGPYPINGRVKFSSFAIATTATSANVEINLDNVSVYEGLRAEVILPTPTPSPTPTPTPEPTASPTPIPTPVPTPKILVSKIDFESSSVGSTYNSIAGTEIKEVNSNKYMDFSSSAVNLALISKTLPSENTGKLTLDFMYKPSQSSPAISVTLVGKDADDTQNYYYVSTSLVWNKIATMFGTYVANTINENKFYRIQYVVDADAYTFDVYVDGVKVTETPFGFRHYGNLVSSLSGPYPLNGRVKFSQLLIATSGSTGTFSGSFDDIYVYTGEKEDILEPTPIPSSTPVPILNVIDFQSETTGGKYKNIAGTTIMEEYYDKYLSYNTSTINLSLISQTLPSYDTGKSTFDFMYKPGQSAPPLNVSILGKDSDDAQAYHYISTQISWNRIATMFGTIVTNVLNQDKFYRIQYVIDADAYTFDVYIDGTKVTNTPFGFRHYGNLVSSLSGPYPLNGRVKFTQLLIATSGAAGTYTGCFDNVRLYVGENEAMPEATPVPTYSPAPTATPEPTLKPTATPSPTPVPTPTPTPKPTPVPPRYTFQFEYKPSTDASYNLKLSGDTSQLPVTLTSSGITAGTGSYAYANSSGFNLIVLDINPTAFTYDIYINGIKKNTSAIAFTGTSRAAFNNLSITAAGDSNGGSFDSFSLYEGGYVKEGYNGISLSATASTTFNTNASVVISPVVINKTGVNYSNAEIQAVLTSSGKIVSTKTISNVELTQGVNYPNKFTVNIPAQKGDYDIKLMLKSGQTALIGESVSVKPYSSVFISSRWYRAKPGDVGGDITTMDAIKRFMATGNKWSYITDNTQINNIANLGVTFQGTLNTIDQITDGYAISFEGNRVIAPWMTWTPPSYWACLNRPAYYNAALAKAKATVDAGATELHHDDAAGNYGMLSWAPACFCSECISGFTQYLKTNLTSVEISALGISNIDTFNYKDYIIAKGITTDTAYVSKRSTTLKTTNDLFLKYQKQLSENYYNRLRAEVSAYAGKNISLSVNMHAMSVNGIGIEDQYMGEIFDYGISEHNEGAFSLTNIVGGSSIRSSTGTVSIISPVVNMHTKELVRPGIAQAYAMGQYMLVPWDIWLPGDGVPRYFGTDDEYGDLYQFIRENDNLFDGYEIPAKVGVLVNWADVAKTTLGNYSTFIMNMFNAGVPFKVLIANYNPDYPMYNIEEGQLQGLEKIITFSDLNSFTAADKTKVINSGVTLVSKDSVNSAFLASSKKASVTGDDNLYTVVRRKGNGSTSLHLLNNDGYNKPSNLTVSISEDFVPANPDAWLYRPGKMPVKLNLTSSMGSFNTVVDEMGDWAVISFEEKGELQRGSFILPKEYTAFNIGNPEPNGSAIMEGDRIYMQSQGKGFNIALRGDNGRLDSATYVYKHIENPLLRDYSVQTAVEKIEGAPNASTGVMIRETSASNAAFIALRRQEDRRLALEYRSETDAVSNYTILDFSTAPYLKLEKQGNTVTPYVSEDGNTWTSVSEGVEISFKKALAGVFTASNNEAEPASAVLGSFNIYAGDLSLNISQIGEVTIRPDVLKLKVGKTKPITVNAVIDGKEITIPSSMYALSSQNASVMTVENNKFVKGTAQGNTSLSVLITAVGGNKTVSKDVSVHDMIEVFSDDFESYTSGAALDSPLWKADRTPAGGFVNVVDRPSGTGKCVQIKISDDPGSVNITADHEVLRETAVVEFDYMFSGSGGKLVYLQGSGMNVSAFATASAFSAMQSDSSSYTFLTNPVKNRWYSVKVIANIESDTCDWYVDGTLVATGKPFRNTTSTLTQIVFGTTTMASNTDIFIDNVKVYDK